MPTERKKIYQLSPEELRNCLIVNYIKLGIHMAIADVRLQILIPEVYRYCANIWTDTFDNIFSEFANGNLPNTEKLQPNVSSYFIHLIGSAYFLRERNKKAEKDGKSDAEAEAEFHRNRGKVAYTRLMMYCDTYHQWPRQEEWLLILQFLVEEKGWKLYDGFYDEPIEIQVKTARVHIKSFAKEFFARRAQRQLAA